MAVVRYTTSVKGTSTKCYVRSKPSYARSNLKLQNHPFKHSAKFPLYIKGPNWISFPLTFLTNPSLPKFKPSTPTLNPNSHVLSKNKNGTQNRQENMIKGGSQRRKYWARRILAWRETPQFFSTPNLSSVKTKQIHSHCTSRRLFRCPEVHWFSSGETLQIPKKSQNLRLQGIWFPLTSWMRVGVVWSLQYFRY